MTAMAVSLPSTSMVVAHVASAEADSSCSQRWASSPAAGASNAPAMARRPPAARRQTLAPAASPLWKATMVRLDACVGAQPARERADEQGTKIMDAQHAGG